MQENAQITETEEDHIVMTGEAEKDTTEEGMIDMTETTGIFVLNSDVTEIVITEIDMTVAVETIVIEMKEDVIMTEIATKEIATETTEEEIVRDPTQVPNHPQKAVIVVIERRKNKEEDVLEVE